MKLLIVFVSLAMAVTAEEPIFPNYHLTFGIPEMARIKAAESAMDFDSSRIIGGVAASLGAHPHLGGLQIHLSNGQTSLCGSSLISNTRLATAAHCWRTHGLPTISFTVVLGSVTLSHGGVRINTNNVVMHPNYNMNNLNNDVAVIRINHVNYNNVIQPIALATGSNNYIGVVATAAGFGRTGETAPATNSLRQVNLQVIDNGSCARLFPAGTVIASSLCTSTAGGRAVCTGDSGGPLYIGSGGGRLLIGITSFASLNGCTAAPSGFARVTSFANWIRSQ